MRKSSAGAVLILGAFLAGCGGGDSNSSSGAALPVNGSGSGVLRAEGLYRGTFSNGLAHETVVLETGQIYMVYGTPFADTLDETGLIEGPANASNGSFSATDTRNYRNTVVIRDFPAFQEVESNQVFPAPISATYDKNGGFNGIISTGGTTVLGRPLTQPFNVTFAGARPDKLAYDYDKPADVSRVAGSWGQIRVLEVTAEGRISLSSRECAAVGTIKPRPSGKNLFDIEWSFLFQPQCPYYGQTLKAIGIARSAGSGAAPADNNFIIVNVDNTRTTKRTYIFSR